MNGPIDTAVSCDGTWQKRGHLSLFGVQAVISVGTRKVLDYEIQSKHCHACQSRGQWDKTTSAYREWMDAHRPHCQINYHASSNSMESAGAKAMWSRSVEKHNLRYTIFVGDGDSSTHKNIKDIYGQDHPVEKHECITHIQKRMGSQLRSLILAHKSTSVIPSAGGKRTGIKGSRGLTAKMIDQVNISNCFVVVLSI